MLNSIGAGELSATARLMLQTKHNPSTHMTTRRFPLVLLAFALLAVPFLSSCSIIGDIFKAGAYTGIIGVVLVLGLIIFLISRFIGGGNKS